MKKSAVITAFLLVLLNFAPAGISVANAFELSPSVCSDSCADACSKYTRPGDFGTCVGRCLQSCVG